MDNHSCWAQSFPHSQSCSWACSSTLSIYKSYWHLGQRMDQSIFGLSSRRAWTTLEPAYGLSLSNVSNSSSYKSLFQCLHITCRRKWREDPPHQQFAYNECGVQLGHSQLTLVVSGQGNKAAKVNKGTSHELVTFIPIISGDGHLISGTVVFPGKSLRQGWVKTTLGDICELFYSHIA